LWKMMPTMKMISGNIVPAIRSTSRSGRESFDTEVPKMPAPEQAGAWRE
jgi:hypothetical protein